MLTSLIAALMFIWRRQDLFRCGHPSSGVCPQIGVCVGTSPEVWLCEKAFICWQFVAMTSPLLSVLFRFFPIFPWVLFTKHLACVLSIVVAEGGKYAANLPYPLFFLFISRRLETRCDARSSRPSSDASAKGFVVSHATPPACRYVHFSPPSTDLFPSIGSLPTADRHVKRCTHFACLIF